MEIAIACRALSKVEAIKGAFNRHHDYFGDINFLILPKECDSNDLNATNETLDNFFNIPLFPMSIDEILHGAKQRAKITYEYFSSNGECAYSVGIEGGRFPLDNLPYMTAAAAIYDGKNYYVGFAPGFVMPKLAMDKILSGTQCHLLGDIFGVPFITEKDGIIGPLTNGKMTRIDYNEWAVLMALTQVVRKDIYSK